jgi:hypothetical protein
MAHRFWILVLALSMSVPLLLSSPGASFPPRIDIYSSDTTALGVVWTPPSPPDSARRELSRIAEVGATAVRLTRLPSDPVAAHADTLGLRLYVDLPVAHVPAPQLQDSLSQASSALKRLFALTQRHSSITHVGLARSADTTVPAACEVLARWTERIHASEASLRTYYVTPFTAAADQCADAVDSPLLDLHGHPTPVERWRQWRSNTTAVDLGAVGTWVRPAATSGLQAPHSPERQARYLERALSRLLDSTRMSPPVVFVSHWRDQAAPVLPTRRYGLHAADGTPRPAARVVQGIYTGTQRVFAFPSGPEPASGPHGILLLGWGLFALLGILYARSLFVRQTVARYFTAPGFYRDALREGRDLHPGANALLLGTVAAALGGTGVCTARMAAAQPSTDRVLAALPRTVQVVLAGGVEHPITAGIVVGGVALGLLGLWMGALVLAAQWWTRFSLAQGLVLVTWPCWPILLVLPLALAAGPGAPVSPSLFGLLLLGGGGLALVYVTGRVLFDYWTITDLPGWTLLFLSALSPLAFLGATVLILTARYDLSFAFLWHLATLTS